MTREVSIDLKNTLVNNIPFKYAHLIKFERPSKPDSLTGLTSTSKERYVYLTDASIDVSFDDGSTSLAGTANGPQVYLANKVLKVGAIQEQTKATASQTSLVIDGNALGAKLPSSGTIPVTISAVSTGVWDIAFQAPVTLDDVREEGFREGDKLSVVIGSVSYPVNIVSFRANNILRVNKIDVDLLTGSQNVILSLSSEEIISILLNKNDSSYASFINREVYIYRVYFNSENHTMIGGTAINLFKGIIQNVSFEDAEDAIRVTWGLTSHWGDFATVRGRVTSDESHRALDENGVPQPLSTLKPVYAYDKGFMHAETSINLAAKYSTLVEKVTVSWNRGILGTGLFKKQRVKVEQVPEDRTTNLDFQLASKSIPIVYGVRPIEGLYIFADTLNTDSSTVYVVIALCEGEVGGIYDLYVDGQSLICTDKADSDARSDQVPRTSEAQDAIEISCSGRADRGDVLQGNLALDLNQIINIFGLTPGGENDDFGQRVSLELASNFIAEGSIFKYNLPTVGGVTLSGNTGLLDQQSKTLNSPIDFTLDFFSGKPGQKAASQLVQIARDNNFKIQNDYWTGSDTTEYWGPNHRLLDTAYVVGRFKISDGETSIPELKFVVRGKLIDCYNYDYSYIKDRKASGEGTLNYDDTYDANFPLGSTVSFFNPADTTTPINTNVQIIDKWTFFNPDGTKNTRFRFNQTPAIYVNGVPTITKFYMQNGSSQKWTMVTYNHKEYTGLLPENGATRADISSAISSLNTTGATAVFNYSSNSDMTVEGDPVHTSPIFRVVSSTLDNLTDSSLLAQNAFLGTVTATALTTLYPASVYAGQTFPAGARLASINTIKLPSSASSTNDVYKGDTIEVVRFNSTSGRSFIQTAEIIAYDGATKIATIDTLWTFIPKSGDTVNVYTRYADKRVSINPAIQTLDYMTSKTYGRGLELSRDINLPSFTTTAQKCDTRSDVSVGSSTSATPGAIYRYPANGNILWQGKVILSKTGKFAANVVTFTDVIGKLTNKWNSWKSYGLNELVYYETKLYRVDGTITDKDTPPTHTTTGVVNGFTYLSTTTTPTTPITLTRVSGSGTDLTIPATSGNPVFDERDGRKISGYSIYDSDDIDYWRLCGWDGHDQRYVTKYQTNIQIDTSTPLFENTNGLLEHYNGILRYTSGQYYLDLEEPAATIIGTSSTTDVRIVTADDIIGKIQLSDEGVRSSFNSVTAAFADPANKFEARNVSFFNSDYLKIDRNVPRKGNLSIPGVTNYYNTRILADSLLNKSRFGLSINFTMRYHGILLLAGEVIQVVYPRYGDSWLASGKKFRIESVNYQPDGLVDIVAKEYDDSFYGLSNLSAGSSGANITAGSSPVTTVPGSPTNLVVTSADSVTELYNGVELFWDNDPSLLSNTNAFTEIYGGLAPKILVNVTSITNPIAPAIGSTLTTTTAHGLVQGMPVYPQTDTNLFDSAKVYFVKEILSPTTFKLALGRADDAITFNPGTGLSIPIRTATLLASVAMPTRSYVDSIVNEDTNRVEKYYWVRHKVLRT
jgi:hypothetical protein